MCIKSKYCKGCGFRTFSGWRVSRLVSVVCVRFCWIQGLIADSGLGLRRYVESTAQLVSAAATYPSDSPALSLSLFLPSSNIRCFSVVFCFCLSFCLSFHRIVFYVCGRYFFLPVLRPSFLMCAFYFFISWCFVSSHVVFSRSIFPFSGSSFRPSFFLRFASLRFVWCGLVSIRVVVFLSFMSFLSL